MKKITCLLAAVFALLGTKAQDETPPYKKTPYYPDVKLLLADSATWYRKDDLPQKTPVMLMYFSPTCEHCKVQTKDILDNFDRFKNIQIIMATPIKFDSMRVFIQKFRLDTYKNIVVGFDPDFSLMSFFRVHKMPFVALYSLWKELIAGFDGGLPAAQLAKKFEQ